MKFTVNNIEFEILEVDKYDENLKIDDNDYRWGMCNYIQRKIYLWKDLSFVNKKQTLIHEVTHAFIEANGFIQVKFDNEIICDFVAAFLSDIQGVVNKYFIEHFNKKGEKYAGSK